jgi:hypothetical protein
METLLAVILSVDMLSADKLSIETLHIDTLLAVILFVDMLSADKLSIETLNMETLLAVILSVDMLIDDKLNAYILPLIFVFVLDEPILIVFDKLDTVCILVIPFLDVELHKLKLPVVIL